MLPPHHVIETFGNSIPANALGKSRSKISIKQRNRQILHQEYNNSPAKRKHQSAQIHQPRDHCSGFKRLGQHETMDSQTAFQTMLMKSALFTRLG